MRLSFRPWRRWRPWAIRSGYWDWAPLLDSEGAPLLDSEGAPLYGKVWIRGRPSSVPANALVTADGAPLVTADGNYLITVA